MTLAKNVLLALALLVALCGTASATVVTGYCLDEPFVTGFGTPPASGAYIYLDDGNCAALGDGDILSTNLFGPDHYGLRISYISVAAGYHVFECVSYMSYPSGYAPCDDGFTGRMDGPQADWTRYFMHSVKVSSSWQPDAPLCTNPNHDPALGYVDCHTTSNSGHKDFLITVGTVRSGNVYNLTMPFPGGDAGGPCTIPLSGGVGTVTANRVCPPY